tara:strand:+ start:528 stop:959 length:432 start_codon:yes stop_codon:yes gene_type:complete
LKESVIQSKKNILFLCTGNSCRSQIAEGFAKKYLSNYNISSAGTEAHGMNPNTIKTMNEIGIDISNQISEKINQEDLNNYDLIITLCGDAKDKCPTFKKEIKHIHWDLSDPANIVGSDDDILKGYAKIRDQILVKIKLLKEKI